MVITVIEAVVEPGRVADLEQAYRDAMAALPSEIVETFLVRNPYASDTYQIITVWESREALLALRASGVTPSGTVIFQAAGATPKHVVLDVMVSSRR